MKMNPIKYLFLYSSVWMFASCVNTYEQTELCFVGDSITELWDLDSYFPEFAIDKFSESGAKIRDVYGWNLETCKDKKTIVLMGTNDIGNTSADEPTADAVLNGAIKRYISLLNKIPFESVVVVSVLPRDLYYRQDRSVNVFIEKFNRAMKLKVRSEIKNASFADVFDSFRDGDYMIRKDLFNDGLHPSPAGYEVLAGKLKGWL